jgi:hypothetical protein
MSKDEVKDKLTHFRLHIMQIQSMAPPITNIVLSSSDSILIQGALYGRRFVHGDKAIRLAERHVVLSIHNINNRASKLGAGETNSLFVNGSQW